MSISDELKALELLLRNGTLTQDEFQMAKRKVLEAGEPVNQPSSHLKEIVSQNELAQLDREWEMERENYMVTGRYGTRYIPSRITSVLGGIFIVGFGAVWTIIATTATRMAPDGFISVIFPLFGIGFVLLGAAMSVNAFIKAGSYQEAYRRYQQRRTELIESGQRG